MIYNLYYIYIYTCVYPHTRWYILTYKYIIYVFESISLHKLKSISPYNIYIYIYLKDLWRCWTLVEIDTISMCLTHVTTSRVPTSLRYVSCGDCGRQPGSFLGQEAYEWSIKQTDMHQDVKFNRIHIVTIYTYVYYIYIYIHVYFFLIYTTTYIYTMCVYKCT